MRKLLLLGFDRITLQHQVQTNSQTWLRSLSHRLAIGNMVLKLALCAGISWTSASTSAVYAYTTQDLLTVYRETGEDYNALTRRAENAARSLAQQRFDSDILQTRVLITVMGDNDGQTVPILVLDVKREDWRRRPDPQFWATYYRSTRLLLDMDGSQPVRPAQPAVPVVPPTTIPLPDPETNPTVPTTPVSPPDLAPNPESPTTRSRTILQSPPGTNTTPETGVNPNPIALPLPAGELGAP